MSNCSCSCGSNCQCGDNCTCSKVTTSAPIICDCTCGPDCQCPPGTCTCPKSTVFEFAQDGPEALRIASVIPYYPFHGVPRFYDISGIDLLNLITDV